MVRQEVSQHYDATARQADRCFAITAVDLREQFAAPAARGDDASLIDGDDRNDVRLAGLEHLGNGSVLGAETDAAVEMDANSGIDSARLRLKRAGDGAGGPIG